MIKILAYYCVLLTTLLGTAHAESTQLPAKITIATDEWCPYICDVTSDKPGYLVEVSKRVFRKLGTEPVFYPLGWQKSVDLVEKSQAQAIIAASITNHGKTILSKELIAIDRTVLVVRKDQLFDNDQVFNTLESLILGVIANYTYDLNGPLDQYIAKRKSKNDRLVILNHYASVKALLVMLNRGSIDVFPENYFVAHYMASSMGVMDKVNMHSIDRHDHLYMAFSPDELGHTLRDAFDREVRLLKDSGALTSIMLSYGIEEHLTSHSDAPKLQTHKE
ncbi:transporter substrate-binding domain-containing protein [Aliiglaciecola litoralis]|uniref:Solute-binding protein family 3/N-terminal domain-containing protein n=1 Tax=Aliiglaciecola litoralis TaxID=582857 RepID=A0ABN1LF02_9ALTE